MGVVFFTRALACSSFKNLCSELGLAPERLRGKLKGLGVPLCTPGWGSCSCPLAIFSAADCSLAARPPLAPPRSTPLPAGTKMEMFLNQADYSYAERHIAITDFLNRLLPKLRQLEQDSPEQRLEYGEECAVARLKLLRGLRSPLSLPTKEEQLQATFAALTDTSPAEHNPLLFKGEPERVADGGCCRMQSGNFRAGSRTPPCLHACLGHSPTSLPALLPTFSLPGPLPAFPHAGIDLLASLITLSNNRELTTMLSLLELEGLTFEKLVAPVDGKRSDLQTCLKAGVDGAVFTAERVEAFTNVLLGMLTGHHLPAVADLSPAGINAVRRAVGEQAAVSTARQCGMAVLLLTAWCNQQGRVLWLHRVLPMRLPAH